MNQNFYYYDSASQLVREDNPFLDKTFVWTYDDGGNITSYKEHFAIGYAAKGIYHLWKGIWEATK